MNRNEKVDGRMRFEWHWVGGFLLVACLSTVWAQGSPEKRDRREAMEREDEGDDRMFGRERRFGPGGPPDGPPPAFQLSEAEKKELVTFINENFPVAAQELEFLKENRPEIYERRLRRMAPEMHRLMDIMRVDPPRAKLMIEERKLELQIRVKARQFQVEEDDAKRTEIRGALRGLLGQAFDCRRQRRELEIQDLETRIRELRDELTSMSARRERILDRQLEDHLERFDPPGGPGRPGGHPPIDRP